jgi:hypothetical protein
MKEMMKQILVLLIIIISIILFVTIVDHDNTIDAPKITPSVTTVSVVTEDVSGITSQIYDVDLISIPSPRGPGQPAAELDVKNVTINWIKTHSNRKIISIVPILNTGDYNYLTGLEIISEQR